MKKAGGGNLKGGRLKGNKVFGIFIGGVGGLGLLTLGRIIADAALVEGYNVKTSEFHGLAQRYGTLQCQVRFSKGPIYSSTIPAGQADLIMGLEPLEGLRGAMYASKEMNSVFLINDYRMYPLKMSIEKAKYPPMDELLGKMAMFSKKVYHLNASEAVEKQFGDIMLTNTYMLGVAVKKKLIPLKRSSVLKSLLATVPEDFRELNRKVFEAGEKHTL